MIRAEFFGDRELVEQIKKEGIRIIPRIKFGLEQFLHQVADVAKTIVPVRHGRLQTSLTYEVSEKGNSSVEGRVGTNVKYGKYVEFGTGLYGPYHTLIVPKEAKVLSWKEKGKRVFAKWSKGMKPRPYLVPALEKVLPQLFEIMKRAMKS